jgi:hypothetical protein
VRQENYSAAHAKATGQAPRLLRKMLYFSKLYSASSSIAC